MRPEVAKFLLIGAKTLQQNSNINTWQGMPRGEFLWIITQITGREDLKAAIDILQKIAAGETSANVPDNLKELLTALEEKNKEIESIEKVSEEKTEATIRRIRELVVRAQLAEQYRQEGVIYKAVPPPPETPPTTPSKARESIVAAKQRISSAPGVKLPPAGTPISPISQTEIYLQVTRPAAKAVADTLTALPIQAVRGVITLGQEAIGISPQTKSALAFAQIGVTSAKMEEAVGELQQKAPQTQNFVARSLLSQTSILRQVEEQHRFLTGFSRLINPQTRVSFSTQPPQVMEKSAVGTRIESFKFTIDLARQQVMGINHFTPRGKSGVSVSQILATAPTVTPTATAVPGQVSAPLIKRVIITPLINFLKWPGQLILRGGLQFGLSALGGLGRAGLGILSKLPFLGLGAGAGVGAAAGGAAVVGGGAVAAGGAAAAGGGAVVAGGGAVGLSGGVIALILGAIAVVTIIILAILNINTYQSAFLETLYVESPFIEVVKSIPQTTFDNNQIPDKIIYSLVVVPKRGKLTSVTIEDSFSVTRDGEKPALSGQSWAVDEINLNNPWKQVFEISLVGIKDKLTDSLLTNTVTVTAGVENQPTQRNSTSVTIVIGKPPQDCPSGWPLTTGYITQGPEGKTSHKDSEAVDIGGNPVGTPVYASHQGTAHFRPTSGGGKVIEIEGFCNGRSIRSRYLHLDNYPSSIVGRMVNKGTVIGYVGNTGSQTTGPHLHYEFKDLPMRPPFISVAIPRGCDGQAQCGIKLGGGQ